MDARDRPPGHDGDVVDGTVTLLLTDVEGSTLRWEESPEAMAADMATHGEILAGVVAAGGGLRPVEQGEGDSVVAVFPRASQAVAAALEAQRRLAAATPGLRVRMAVHSGEIEARDGRYDGPVIIRCARLRACAHGGQVLLSDVAAGLAADDLPEGAALVDLGVHPLRDLARPERVWELVHADLAELGALRSAPGAGYNIPAAPTPLVGRRAELAELAALVGERRLITITGAGGVGKSRLAQQLATDLLAGLPDGAFWVDLATLDDGERLASTVAAAVGMTEVPGRTVEDQLVMRLAPTHALLVLDNCEHLLEAVAGLVERLLAGCSGLRVLATSREPLAVEGETTWRAPSLAVPPGEPPGIERLEDYASVELFVERARRSRPNFALNERTALPVRQLCRRLDGIPLAIELAAARVRSLPVERLAAGLDNRFRLLTGGSRSAVARQRTLLASVDWSYDLLDPAEQVTLCRLSAFVGDFTLDAAERVCAGGDVDCVDVLDLLARLVDKSLVNLVEATGRYRLLETIRHYAVERAGADELAASRDRHLAWFLERVRAEDLDHRMPTVAMAAAFEADYANLTAALDWSLAGEPAVDLMAGLSLVWVWRSRSADAELWAERVLERLEPESGPWARAVTHLASPLGVAGGPPTPDAEELLPGVLAAAQAAGDAWAASRLMVQLGTLRAVGRDGPGGLELIDEAAALARTTGDEGGRIHALAAGAVMANTLNRTRRARAYLAELDAYELAGYLHSYLLVMARAIEAGMSGRHTEAVTTIEAALADAPPAPRTGLLVMLSRQAAATGDVALADRAVALLPPPHERGLWDGGVGSLLAHQALVHGDRDGAVRGALAAHRGGFGRGVETITSAPAAETAAAAGAYDVAEQMLAEVPFTPRDDDLTWALEAGTARALIALGRGLPADAEHHAVTVLDLARREGQLPRVATALELLACTSADADRSARLAAAAARIRAETGYTLRAAVVTDTLRQVPEAEGSALDWQEAAAWALRGRGERGRPAFGWDGLTPTEAAVVDLVAEGLSNPRIAKRRGVEVSTVKTHLHHVFRKLGVTTRAQLAAVATERRAGQAS
jgi:predicted ATPase/DNA-binding NarL/FixJ family response regulator